MRELSLLIRLRLRGALQIKGRRGKKIAGWKKVLFALLMVYLVGVMAFLFGGMSYALVSQLKDLGLSWLALALGAFLAAALCFILTVFSTQSQIFQARDNDQLLSLPLTAGQIAASRLLSMLALEYLYNFVVMIPTEGVYCWLMRPGWVFYPMLLLLSLLLPLLPLSLAGAVGYLFALVSSRFARLKNLIVILLSVGAFCLYFYFCMNLNQYMFLLLQRGESLAGVFRKSLPPFYHFAAALEQGAWGSFVICALWSVVPAALLYFLLAKGFFRVGSASGVKTPYKRRPLRESSPWAAVLKKEAARLVSMPTYLFNSSVGAFLMVILAAMAALKGEGVVSLMAMDLPAEASAALEGLLSQLLTAALCFCSLMICTTAPSVSLEGDKLWIMRSSPIAPRQVFAGKLALDLALLFPSVAVSAVILSLSLPLRWADIACLTAAPLCFGLFMALVGLYANLCLPRFDYASDTAVVKQSASVMVSTLGGMGLLALFIGGYLLLGRKFLSYYQFCGASCLILSAACGLLWRLICTDGVRRYEEF